MNKYVFMLVLLLPCIVIPALSQKYPKFDKISKLNDGDILIKNGIYKNKFYENYPKKLKADHITMAVKENRNDPDSRIITIPIIKLYSLSDNPKEPVFLLNGGPGGTNINNFAMWLLDEHDIVLVGYRGIDGSVKLDSKELAKAMVTDSNTFSEEHFKKIGSAWNKELKRYTKEGIDINSYNIIEVIDDIENARVKLGYNKINFFGYSFGSRLAYIYGLRYPESINRSVIALINPPGHFYHNPEVEDNVLKMYDELWKNDSSNLEQSDNIIKTIQNVFVKLPVQWKKIHIDPAKVRFMMYNYLQSTHGTAQIFDAFISADNGDYSGLACLVMMYDLLPLMRSKGMGDLVAKGGTADYIEGENYLNITDSKENLLGAPFSKIFAIVKYSDFEIRIIPEEYRKLDTSYINTLMINGNLDIATPLSNARELINYLPNGELVVLSDCSHFDLWLKQPEMYKNLMKEYFLSGQVNVEHFKYIPADLGKQEHRLQKMGKSFYTLKRLGLLKIMAKITH